MKKTIIVFLTVLGFFAANSEVSAALELAWPNSPLNTPLNENTNVAVLIQYFYEWGMGLGGLAAFIALVIAGVQYLTSAGDATKMKDSMDRIKSAALGLVLLLGSVLILNTINPQLTQLKAPTFPLEEGEWKTDLNLEDRLAVTSEDCTKAILYERKNLEGPSKTISLGTTDFGGQLNIESLELEGDCYLLLYQLARAEENSDYPAVPISTTPLKEMGGYGTTFRSAKLVDW